MIAHDGNEVEDRPAANVDPDLNHHEHPGAAGHNCDTITLTKMVEM